MDKALLEKKFRAMGARLRFRTRSNNRWRGSRFVGEDESGYNIDIVNDKKGETFSLQHWGEDVGVKLDVIDVRPELRHLLLLDRESGAKLLCGHDERHWFVAGVPEKGVRGVQDAMDALKPKEVREASQGLKRKHRNKRRNDAFIRQGEWFFTPVTKADVDEKLILKGEPLIRSGARGGKPHMCQFLYRTGGETLYVKRDGGMGGTKTLNEEQFQKNMRDPDWKDRFGWSQQKINMDVLVKGRITHSDHATVVLDTWHKVSMNTEGDAAFAGEKILFVD